MTISKFLYTNGFYSFEGHSQQVPRQVQDLIKLSSRSNINVMEIGFNAGHSAEVFLQHNSTLKLLSFDLGSYNYVIKGKEYIDATYPNRHELILGDSTVTIPKYINENPDKRFDVIFIDGGHEYPVAKADLENCMKMANNDTIVMIDDTIYTKGWEKDYTVGPTKAWVEFVNNGRIKEMNRVDYADGRGMSWGNYVL